MARPGRDVDRVLWLRPHVVGRVRLRLLNSASSAACLSAHLARYVHVHELPDSRGQRPAARLLQHHAGGHAIRHYPGRSAGRAGGPQGAGWTARVCCGGQARGGEGADLHSSASPSVGCGLGRVVGGGWSPKLSFRVTRG